MSPAPAEDVITTGPVQEQNTNLQGNDMTREERTAYEASNAGKR